jgi:hypothetical protein
VNPLPEDAKEALKSINPTLGSSDLTVLKWWNEDHRISKGSDENDAVQEI